MIILDTNVLSELVKRVPDRRVVQWVAAQPFLSLFTTAVTEAEMLLGVAMLPAGKRRQALHQAIGEIFAEDLADRVLAFDSAAAAFFAEIVAIRRQSGRPISHADAQIAAISRCYGATVATRNVADFDGCGVMSHNPWA